MVSSNVLYVVFAHSIFLKINGSVGGFFGGGTDGNCREE
ncbi:MAG: hypothetical protein ACJAZY_001573 [Spirosomataceae bacterium]|jgi:hypothetical protein